MILNLPKVSLEDFGVKIVGYEKRFRAELNFMSLSQMGH